MRLIKGSHGGPLLLRARCAPDNCSIASDAGVRLQVPRMEDQPKSRRQADFIVIETPPGININTVECEAVPVPAAVAQIPKPTTCSIMQAAAGSRLCCGGGTSGHSGDGKGGRGRPRRQPRNPLLWRRQGRASQVSFS